MHIKIKNHILSSIFSIIFKIYIFDLKQTHLLFTSLNIFQLNNSAHLYHTIHHLAILILYNQCNEQFYFL